MKYRDESDATYDLSLTILMIFCNAIVVVGPFIVLALIGLRIFPKPLCHKLMDWMGVEPENDDADVKSSKNHDDIHKSAVEVAVAQEHTNGIELTNMDAHIVFDNGDDDQQKDRNIFNAIYPTQLSASGNPNFVKLEE